MSKYCRPDASDEEKKFFAALEAEAAKPIVKRAALPDNDPDFFLSPFRDIQWMSEDKTQTAVCRTRKALRKRLEVKTVGQLIDRAITDSLTPLLEALIPSEEWERLEKLAGQVLEYARLAEKFRAHAYPIASIPEKIVLDVHSLIGIGGPSRVSKKPKLFYWEREFYPRILGVYSACFDAEPTSHAYTEKVGDKSGGSSNPTERDKLVLGSTAAFIDEVLETLNERLLDDDVRRAFPYHDTISLLQEASEPPGFRGRIAKWKKVANENDETEISPSQLSWRYWRREIEDELKI